MKKLLLILLCLPLLFSSCSKEDCNCPTNTNNNNNSSEPSSLIVGLWDVIQYDWSDSLDMVNGLITFSSFPGDSDFWENPGGSMKLDFREDGMVYSSSYDGSGTPIDIEDDEYGVTGNALYYKGYWLISSISNTNMIITKTEEDEEETVYCER
jgi:hypothetical protein